MRVHDRQGGQLSMLPLSFRGGQFPYRKEHPEVWGGERMSKVLVSDESRKQPGCSIRTKHRLPPVVWVDIRGARRYNAIRHRVFLQPRSPTILLDLDRVTAPRHLSTMREWRNWQTRET